MINVNESGTQRTDATGYISTITPGCVVSPARAPRILCCDRRSGRQTAPRPAAQLPPGRLKPMIFIAGGGEEDR